MAVQHIAQSAVLVPPFDAESRVLETVVLVAVALPEGAGADLPPAVVEAASNVIGYDHILEVSVLDRWSVMLRLRVAGMGSQRVADPALGPALEAELAAVLNAAGHPSASVAVASAGRPKSERVRDRELWHEKLTEVHLRARRQAEDMSFSSEIAQIIERGQIRTMFQAIVAATDGEVLGYEALSRGPTGHRWERPDLLLEAAQRGGMSAVVQWEMMRLARVRATERLRSTHALLFVNAPDMRFWPEAPVDGDSGNVLWPWDRTVTEVSERSPIENLPAVWETRDRGRARGIRFALDDVGAGYAGLAALALLAPDFVKIDMALIRGCHRDPAKQAVIAALVQYARQTGAAVIAEGVETADESRAVCGLGVDLLQGFLYARPTEHPSR
jgi:EAL domain-containing protein (putative c-di-GMP-specific phosphodiesterase class I)